MNLTKEELYNIIDKCNAHWDNATSHAVCREIMTEIELLLEQRSKNKKTPKKKKLVKSKRKTNTTELKCSLLKIDVGGKDCKDEWPYNKSNYCNVCRSKYLK